MGETLAVNAAETNIFRSPAFVEECRQRFGLSYHVSYAFNCAESVSFAGKNVLEVGGSLPPEFVFDILGAKTWTAIETPDYEDSLAEAGGITHKGTLLHAETDVIPTKGFGTPFAARYSFLLANIEDLPESHREQYDLVFSIATFEHVQKMPAALDRMYQALKPGGKLFSLFSPIWSAYDGHHLPEMADASGQRVDRSVIPPWGHLLARPPEMYHYLCTRTDPETAGRMVYYIYQAPFINRLFTEDYLGYIAQTPFKVINLARPFTAPVPPNIQSALATLYPGRAHFDNNGLYIILEK
ncbi:MAG: methyltransferase domain-containing protein [Terriglobales bacterium]